LVWLALHERGAQIVIHEGRMKFNRPATGDFSAACILPAGKKLADFVAQYERRGKARIALTARIDCGGQTVAEFEGAFAAMRAKQAETF
ncbi:MAG TPA: YiiD C-terminal domain-containing protein, partial [Gammaproteobacteria bacterium]